MARVFISLLCLYFITSVDAQYQNALCSNGNVGFDLSCSSQIFQSGGYDSCTVKYFPTNSSECRRMEFGSFVDNIKLGGVILEPYVYTFKGRRFETNYTVLNVTFTNIKWNTMKFRFERKGSPIKNHCRDIEIAHNVTVQEQSVLYYDCWWSDQDAMYVGENYILDFQAEGDLGVKRGQYYFTVPSVNQLSPKVKEDWKPFVYIEIGGKDSMILHVTAAPAELGIDKYKIEVKKECNGCDDIKPPTSIIKALGEVTFSYSLLNKPGSYHFVVTPIHKSINFQSVKSPVIVISTGADPGTMICIASVTSLVVGVLFVCYIVLWVVRRHACMDRYKLALNEDTSRNLVLYSSSNKVHSDCAGSLVQYLRQELGLHVAHEPDLAGTAHRDPFLWHKQAFGAATTVIHVIGPDGAAGRSLDQLQMTLLKEAVITKQVINVTFDYSGPIPVETSNEKTFHLLKDWDKFIKYMTKNQPIRIQLQRTESGRRLYDNLKDAKKHFGNKKIQVVVKDPECGSVDKKALL